MHTGLKELKRIDVIAIVEEGSNQEERREDALLLLEKGTDWHDPGELCVYMKNGMTSHESFDVRPKSAFFKRWVEKASEHGWYACAGGMGWKAYFIPAEDMKKMFEAFGIMDMIRKEDNSLQSNKE